MARQEEPTRQQQQLAYRQLWKFGWPETLEAALASPVHLVCINAVARRLGRAPVPATPVPCLGIGAPVPPTPTEPPQHKPGGRQPWRMPAGAFDAKRAAAGDRDD